MNALNVLQRTLERLPIRGKGRLADLLFQTIRRDELECHPLHDVTVFLRPSQRIERLMWAGAYERELLGLFKKILKPGMTVLDVGANIGYFSAIAAGLVGSQGSVHAFEPIPECFARLQRNLSSFRCFHGHSCAVGATTGTATIYFNEHELGWGSLFSDNDLTRSVDVQVINLDEWGARADIHSVDFIKMDVEGGEYQVLQGAGRILRELRPVIAAELNRVCLNRDHHSPEDVVQVLQAEGYHAFSFNDGVLAIPREADQILSGLRAYTKSPFDRSNKS